jgi:hypothetical protein
LGKRSIFFRQNAGVRRAGAWWFFDFPQLLPLLALGLAEGGHGPFDVGGDELNGFDGP